MARMANVGTTGRVGNVIITENNIQMALDQLDNATELVLTKIGMKAEAYAKKLCPVDTGLLRNSITFDVMEDELEVGTNVEYAAYIELGTGPNFTPPASWIEFNAPRGKGVGGHYVTARKFLQPAIENHLDQYKTIIEDGLRNGA